MKTLVVISHPTPEQSVAIKALQQVAEGTDSVTVRHLDTLYGKDIDNFDVAAEQQAHEAADRIVFLYPTHWFNTTPMLKAYLNQVWTYGWAFGPNGTALKDKELQIVTTAGATEFTYSPEGLIHSTMDEVLSPMKASALYVGMKYNAPLAFYGAMGLVDEQLDRMKQSFAQCLQAPLASVAQI
jgi:glutathione-regulated potassium-efflux system ancillary protein KefF